MMHQPSVKVNMFLSQIDQRIEKLKQDQLEVFAVDADASFEDA